MMPYGNNYTRLAGIIREFNHHRAVIEFPRYQKKIPVPTRFIRSELCDQLNLEHELEIETWYLKKNRVLPLYEPRNLKNN
ncbi:MAG: hypothetical protein ACTSWW_08300 [Promethearchaeota archaeon]